MDGNKIVFYWRKNENFYFIGEWWKNDILVRNEANYYSI